jgi:hypothetical protein
MRSEVQMRVETKLMATLVVVTATLYASADRGLAATNCWLSHP